MSDEFNIGAGTLTISDGVSTFDLSYADGHLAIAPMPATATLSGALSLSGSFSVPIERVHMKLPPPPPIRFRLGKRWAWVRAIGTHARTPDRISVHYVQLSPWRRWYEPGQKRPRRAKVVPRA